MAVCGVIAEYDPFHKGHERHLLWAREAAGAEQVVCVISGCFTQRGLPALLSPYDRAEMALRCGADIVLQLPYAFSVREGDFFALGGVQILSALGCVSHLSFGCEEKALPYLNDAAALLETPDEALEEAVQAGLSEGLSYAAAAGRAVEKRLQAPPRALDRPNAALALSYLRAIRRLGSPLIPVPVPREGHYHARELTGAPSASALRSAISRGDWQGISGAIPQEALPVLEKALLAGRVCPPERMDPFLTLALMRRTEREIAMLPGIGEGLEKRILKAARSAVSREELIRLVKTRRYTYGRISRALCHAVTNVTWDELPSLPESARVLGFRESARPLLRWMRKSGFPLFTRPALSNPLDQRADETWHALAGLPRAEAYRRGPIILP